MYFRGEEPDKKTSPNTSNPLVPKIRNMPQTAIPSLHPLFSISYNNTTVIISTPPHLSRYQPPRRHHYHQPPTHSPSDSTPP